MNDRNLYTSRIQKHILSSFKRYLFKQSEHEKDETCESLCDFLSEIWVEFSLFTFHLTLQLTVLRMHEQSLTDRLVVASEEQDVLYVLHWLSEMKENKCLEQAINSKREWKSTISRLCEV